MTTTTSTSQNRHRKFPVYNNFIDFYLKWPIDGCHITLYVGMDYAVNRQEDYFRPLATMIATIDTLSKDSTPLLRKELSSRVFRDVLESIAKYKAEERTWYILGAL